MLACNAAEACLYSSSRWYAANDDASENPNKKPTIPPRKPPMGFFCTGVVPTFGACACVTGTSSRRTRVVDNERDCSTVLRATERRYSEVIMVGSVVTAVDGERTKAGLRASGCGCHPNFPFSLAPRQSCSQTVLSPLQ